MKKSWIFVEVIESGDDKTFKPLAGTEDNKCANRALAAMKAYKDEIIKSEKLDLTLIHTSVIDSIEYNSAIEECLNPNNEDKVAKIFSLIESK